MTVLAGPLSLSSGQFEALRSLVVSQGWKSGFEAFGATLSALQAEELRADISLRHTGWKAFFSPVAKNHALVLENGIGSASISLAKDFVQVTALFPNEAQLVIATQRIQYLGIQNISVLREASEFHVHADVVAIIGIDPGILQPRQLARLRVVIQGTKNYFFAAFKAQHNFSLKFLLQFWKSSRQLALQSQRKLYRYHGKRSNFYELSKVFGETNVPYRELLALPVVCGLALLCTAEAMPSFLDEVLGSIQASLVGSEWQELAISGIFLSRPHGLTLIIDSKVGQGIICKVALDSEAEMRLGVNFQCLERLGESSFSTCIPQAVKITAGGGRRLFLESMVTGSPVKPDQMDDSSYLDLLGNASRWLTQVHEYTAVKTTMDERLMDALVLSPLRRAFNLFPREDWDKFDRIRDYLVFTLANKDMPLVRSHGDYSIDNVLTTKGSTEIAGVIDWDLSQPASMPLLDLLYFVLTADRARTGREAGTVFAEKLMPFSFSAAEAAIIQEYCSALGIREDAVFSLTLLAWIYHLAFRLQHGETYYFRHLADAVIKRPLAFLLSRIESSKQVQN